MADLPPVDDDLLARLLSVADTLAERPDHLDVARKLEWIVDTMILRGQMPKTFRRLIGKVGGERTSVRLALFPDKYAIESEPIDCASLAHLCKVKCCSFEVALSVQDIEEQSAPWRVDKPYVLPKNEAGGCVCADATGGCTIYDKRPGACRAYDCRGDTRVWLDFDARIPAPE